jgi:signal transduction histidine kinase
LSSSRQVLAERVKELNCLYSLSRLFDRRDLNLPELLTRTVELIPPAWQFPEITAARILVDEQEYKTESFRDSSWSQTTPIIVDGAHAGKLELVYLQERPEADEGPFLHEERSLLNVIAQRIGEVIERKTAEEHLVTYRQQLRSLALELSRLDEQSRRRVSSELHDGIAQQLVLVQIQLGMLLADLTTIDSRRKVEDIRDLVGQTIRQTRTLIFELSPPVLYEHGLEEALDWLVQQIRVRFHLDVQLETEGPRIDLSPELRTVLFRSCAELLANVGRHALADRAWLLVRYEEKRVRLTVRDNGIGFDLNDAWTRAAQKGSFGLFSIRERMRELGGDLIIDSQPGRGTRAGLVLSV